MKELNYYLVFIFCTIRILIFPMEADLSLHKAVLSNDLEQVKYRVEHGADIYARNQSGRTVFDYAIENRAYKKIAAYLYPYYFDLKSLEKRIGYTFKNVAKLIKAFTPRQICADRNYETYEWLGDSILHEILTVILYNDNHYDKDEGQLSNARIALEQKETLAELSKWLKFDDYIICRDKEKITVNMLEDVVESVIAAIYKDGGAGAAEKFIRRFWIPMINDTNQSPMNPVHIVDKWKKANQKKVDKKYPKVSNGFKCEMSWGKLKSVGSSPIKRVAHYYAAKKFIENLPDQYQAYKDMLIVSPLSDQYRLSDEEVTCQVDPKIWESNIYCHFSYLLTMISKMLDYSDPDVATKKSGPDHNPRFVVSIDFDGSDGVITGRPAKKQKKAKEHAAQLACEAWKIGVMQYLEMKEDKNIDIRKLIFLLKLKLSIDYGMKNARMFVKELFDQLEELKFGKPVFDDYRVGGLVSNPQSSFFYSVIYCPGLLNKPIKSDACPSIKKARESAALKVLEKFMAKL